MGVSCETVCILTAACWVESRLLGSDWSVSKNKWLGFFLFKFCLIFSWGALSVTVHTFFAVTSRLTWCEVKSRKVVQYYSGGYDPSQWEFERRWLPFVCLHVCLTLICTWSAAELLSTADTVARHWCFALCRNKPCVVWVCLSSTPASTFLLFLLLWNLSATPLSRLQSQTAAKHCQWLHRKQWLAHGISFLVVLNSSESSEPIH